MSAYIPPHRRKNSSGKQKETQANITTTERTRNDPRNIGSTRWKPIGHPKLAPSNDEMKHDAIVADRFTRICCINLKRRPDRWTTFCSRMKLALGKDSAVCEKLERFDAVDGARVMGKRNHMNQQDILKANDNEFPNLEWDATKNALYDRHIQAPMIKLMTPGEVGCAMSHVRLWAQLAESNDENTTMLILEDDAVFYSRKTGTTNFVDAMQQVWKTLPSDWDILYLGFSDRGERKYIDKGSNEAPKSIQIRLFRPTYGFHTHAYVLKASAAKVLLSQLPVNGPLDVWLADNEWFGLNVYCTVVANEGWEGQGAWLVSQRRHDTKSDIGQSGREAT